MPRLIPVLLLCLPLFLFGQTDSTAYNGPDSLDRGTNNIPTLSLDDLDGDSQGQDISGLLQSSQDVYTRNAGFNFSAGRFRIRGMNGNNFIVHLNGVVMNDPELGFAIWANWGGLNDVTRYPETGAGVAASDYSFGGVQGFSNLDLRASTKRAGTRISYAASNRAYRNRAMVTYNTGQQANGLSVTGSLSGRWAEEGYVEGTSYSNLAYFLSLEKKVNDKHTIGLIGLGSPSLRGRSSLATLEAYELRDDNYYNPYWGFQQGEKRNSRMRYSHKPIIQAWHAFQVNDDLQIKTTAYTQFGKYYQTRMDWTDANDPRPDYYRKLPSYFVDIHDTEGIPALRDRWMNDPTFYQLDWDSFYQANGKNLHTVENANGVEGNSFTANRSKFIVEAAHSDPFLLGVNINVQDQLSETKRLVGGLNINTYTSDNYRRLDDLLGGDYWLDVNRFAEGTLGAVGGQNDLDNPNRIITEDDRYGYSYEMHKRTADLFVQYDEQLEKVDYYIGATLNTQSFWRDGQYRNELFPDNSKGESERQSFTTGGVKAGATYKITGRHFIGGDIAFLSRAPLIRNAFLSPRSRNTIVPGLTPEQVTSGEISYQVRYPDFKARLTGYSATINDQTSIFTFFSEGSNDLINLVTSNIDQSYTGMELGFEGKVTSTLTLSGALGHGQHLYTSRPTVTSVVDETDTQEPSELAYLENYRVGRTPQTAFNVGLNYRDPKFWFVGLNYSYFTNIFIDPLATRRTADVVDGLVVEDPQWEAILAQDELDGAGVLNFFGGKSWRFDYKYYLLVTLNVSNVLDKTDFNTGGYEQGRPTASSLDLFGNRYGFMYGRTYFAMVRFSF